MSIDERGEFSAGSSVLAQALEDLITEGRGTTYTTLNDTKIAVSKLMFGVVEKDDAVLGNGISLGSKVDEADGI